MSRVEPAAKIVADVASEAERLLRDRATQVTP